VIRVYFDAEGTVLLTEFKVQIGQHLATVEHTQMRSLARSHRVMSRIARRKMKYFGQEVFEFSEATSGNLSDPVYIAARQFCLQRTRGEGIDKAARE
jgi:hypothetical protein